MKGLTPILLVSILLLVSRGLRQGPIAHYGCLLKQKLDVEVLPVQIGYYFSAFTVDKPWMGRVRLQSMVSLHALALLNACLPVNMSFA